MNGKWGQWIGNRGLVREVSDNHFRGKLYKDRKYIKAAAWLDILDKKKLI